MLYRVAEATIKDVVAGMSIDQVLADKQPIVEELTLRLRVPELTELADLRVGERGLRRAAPPEMAVQEVHRARHRDRQERRDDDPAGIIPLRARKNDVGNDAIAEDDQNRGAENLGENW